MSTGSPRAMTRDVVALTTGLAAVGVALGPAVAAVAAHTVQHLRRVHASARHVRAGGTFTITAIARYRVPEEFAVAYYFDAATVTMPDETFAQGYPPQPGDNPTCEYDNRFGTTTSTVGSFRVAPDATGRFAVTTCTETLSFGGGPDRPGDRCKVRTFSIR
jgi:hypothetical protein